MGGTKSGRPSSSAARAASRRSRRVRGHAAGQEQACRPARFRRRLQPPHQGGDHRALERGHQVAHLPGHLRGIGHGRDPLAAHVVEHGGLDPAEREVGAAVLDAGDRELDARGRWRPARGGRSPARRGSRGRGAWPPCRRPRPPRRRGSARAAGSRRAPGISNRLVCPPETTRASAGRGMSPWARNGASRWPAMWCTGHQRLAVHERDGLGHLHAHEQRAHEAGPLGHRHRVQVGVAEPRLRHGPRDHRADVLDVVSRRQLRHHAAVRRVDLGLRGDHVGEDAAAVLHHRRRRLVAGRLDGQHASPGPCQPPQALRVRRHGRRRARR